MKITYIGHAGFIVDAGNTSILIDPWFYAANLASIFPYPDNEFMVSAVLDRQFDYLYLSHAHTDHFDRRLLERLNRDMTVICPSYRSRELEMLLKDMGFKTQIKLGHLQQQILNEDVTVMMLLDSSAAEDSGLLIDHRGERFLDLNDCQVNVGELPQADMLACQFSGAIHYPQTYDMYTAEEKDQKADRAVQTYIDIFERKIAAIKPKCFIPSAGPFCFLHPNLMQYNPGPDETTVFLSWERFASQIPHLLSPDQILRVFPGDEIDTDSTGLTTINHRYDVLNPYPNDTLEAYAERRRSETAPFFANDAPEVPTEDLRAHWQEIHRTSRRLLQYRDFSKSFIIQAYEQQDIVDAHQRQDNWLKRWYISVSGAAVSVDDVPPADFVSEYTFKLPMLMLRKVIDKETNWDEMVASHHMLLSRDPDIFDPQFFALLRYHHVPSRSLLFAQAAIDASELTEIPNCRGTMIQRYCPHAGEDMAGVEVIDGVIVCPRHRWQWDIETGFCLQGGNLPLRVVHKETAGV